MLSRRPIIAPLSPALINRLYWLDELTQEQIAKRRHCTSQNIQRYMQRHHIKTRGSRRKVADCVVAGCEEPTCRIKRWTKAGTIRFTWTNRCAVHYHEWWRRIQRESARRRRERRGIPARPVQLTERGLALGQLSTIAPDR